GKTGTAEKAMPSGGYISGKYVASFVGFAPARRAEIVAMIAIDEPDPAIGYHGGGVAAPVFAAVVGPTLPYLGIPPDDEGKGLWPDEGLIADRTLEAENETKIDSTSQIAEPIEPSADEGPDRAILPDFSGMTSRQAVVQLAAIGLRASLYGQGVVNHQSPPPGSPLEQTDGRLELWLGNTQGQ
ncbi:MAG: penicillin-binding transpeptidase domain-containing protein, partial [Acidobacteriota bacterium]